MFIVGIFKSKAKTHNRTLKSQGSCKTNKECLSQITAKTHVDGTLTIFRIKTHNHENHVQHLRLPKSAREDIAAQLISGVSQAR